MYAAMDIAEDRQATIDSTEDMYAAIDIAEKQANRSSMVLFVICVCRVCIVFGFLFSTTSKWIILGYMATFAYPTKSQWRFSKLAITVQDL